MMPPNSFLTTSSRGIKGLCSAKIFRHYCNSSVAVGSLQQGEEENYELFFVKNGCISLHFRNDLGPRKQLNLIEHDLDGTKRSELFLNSEHSRGLCKVLDKLEPLVKEIGECSFQSNFAETPLLKSDSFEVSLTEKITGRFLGVYHHHPVYGREGPLILPAHNLSNMVESLRKMNTSDFAPNDGTIEDSPNISRIESNNSANENFIELEALKSANTSIAKNTESGDLRISKISRAETTPKEEQITNSSSVLVPESSLKEFSKKLSALVEKTSKLFKGEVSQTHLETLFLVPTNNTILLVLDEIDFSLKLLQISNDGESVGSVTLDFDGAEKLKNYLLQDKNNGGVINLLTE